VLAGYRLDAIVGRGGMGVVYRATQLDLGRTVALKVVAADLLEDATARRRIVARTRHRFTADAIQTRWSLRGGRARRGRPVPELGAGRQRGGGAARRLAPRRRQPPDLAARRHAVLRAQRAQRLHGRAAAGAGCRDGAGPAAATAVVEPAARPDARRRAAPALRDGPCGHGRPPPDRTRVRAVMIMCHPTLTLRARELALPAGAAMHQRRGGSTRISFPRFSICAIAQALSICAYVYRTGLCRVSM
jgi:hypothetical protein